jgi:hypothetical protein
MENNYLNIILNERDKIFEIQKFIKSKNIDNCKIIKEIYKKDINNVLK